MNGKLIIISGPSQVGKDSIIKELAKDKRLNLATVATNTTRSKRPGESFRLYNFISEADFQKLIKNDELLEWAIVHNHHYGTPKKAVLKALESGKNVIIDIDVQGAAQIKAKMPNALLIFVTAESAAEVKRRIFDSSKISAVQKKTRWEAAQRELKAKSSYNYIVINRRGKLKNAVIQVKNFILKELGQALTK